MTILGGENVAQTKFNTIRLRVSGDLSCTYDVIPKNQIENVGLAFVTKAKAIKFAKSTGKLGWKKQAEIYRKKVHWYNHSVSEEQTAKFLGGKYFGYVPENKAKEYAPYGYGEYAEKIRERYNLRLRG